jgi:hypothetical protein
MAVAIRTTDFPEGTGEGFYKRVVTEVNLAENPPQGMIFHWAGDLDGKFTVTEIWDSHDANERFLEERLFPTIRKLSGREPRQSRQPVVSEHPVYNYIPGR